MSDASQSPAFLPHAINVASSYGFRPLRDVDPTMYRDTVGRQPISFDKAAILCAHNTSTHDPEPVLAQYLIPAPATKGRAGSGAEPIPSTFCLHTSGSPHSMSEALVIKATMMTLTEYGTAVDRVRINTTGDRDSRERFQRELSAFVKRRFAAPSCDIPEESRTAVLERPIFLLESAEPSLADIAREAPQPIHYLSERARTHLRNVLEHLEHLGIPYEIDGSLYDREREPRFLFRFDLGDDTSSIACAHGGRYDEYVTRLTGRRENATVQASIIFNQKKAATVATAPAATPRAYLVHLGWRAKLHGFEVVDILRNAGIPAIHTFDASRISPQLEAAQRTGACFTVIMGEREARDHTVILRRLSDNSQETVTLLALPKIVKKWAK